MSKKKPMLVQSLIFLPDVSMKQARAWATSHRFKPGRAFRTGSSLRLRQLDPTIMRKMRTITLGRSRTVGLVKAIVGKKR